MTWTIYVVLILFGLFILLLIINPNLSCFGKRIRSPFYPVSRKKKIRTVTREYKFDLGGQDKKPAEKTTAADADKKKQAEDYGFKLD